MNLPFSLLQKIKVAMLLFFIMVCTLLIRMLEDRSLKAMAGSFASIYNDRLVPSADLFEVSSNLFEKKRHLDDLLQDGKNVVAETTLLLRKKDLSIDSLLRKYEATFLVKREKNKLATLRAQLAYIRSLENKIMQSLFSNNGAATNLNDLRVLNASYVKIVANLSALSKIQTEVGEDLIKKTERIMAGNRLFSSLQLVLAIIIGILIVAILFTSNVVNISKEKFNLN